MVMRKTHILYFKPKSKVNVLLWGALCSPFISAEETRLLMGCREKNREKGRSRTNGYALNRNSLFQFKQKDA